MTGKHAGWLLPPLCLACLGWLPARGDEPTETAQPAASATAVPVAGTSVTATSSPAASTTAGSVSAASATATRPVDGSPIDLAILLDEHMLLVRLQVRHGDMPFFELWRQFVEGKFNSADKDGNGVLDAEEFKAVKPLLPPTASDANGPNAARGGRRRNQGNRQIVDAADGAETSHELSPGVTRDEFVEFLRKTATGPVQITSAFEASPASRSLFTRLDTNHDDKLSADECQHAFDTLHPLDLDEADLFTQNQLTTDVPGADYSVQPRRTRQRATPIRLVVKQLPFSNSPASLAWADRAGQHFAPAGSTKPKVPQHLRRAVMLYDDAVFASIDADGDGTLDREELAHLMRRPTPNLEMIVSLADKGTVEATELRLDRALRFDPAAVPEESGRPARLTAGGEQVEMTASEFVDPDSGDRGAALVNNLKQFDQDKNDYLDERETRQIGQINFKALDANGDGKLYFDEIARYIDAQSAAANVRLVIGLVDHDHCLFESLDTNGDQQLGRRELGRLTDRLKAWDRDGDGQLAFDEVPRRYTLRVGQDQAQLPFNETFGLATYSSGSMVGSASKSGPLWFTEMDRNSDGDLSRREFLGTAAQFRQIDTDGDQLIDPDEALRATPVANEESAAEKTAPASNPAANGSE